MFDYTPNQSQIISPSKLYYSLMGKKPSQDSIRQKLKKSRHKEMFTELATHQEQTVHQKHQQHHQHHYRKIQEDSEEDVELQVLQRENNNLDAVCQAINRLISKNKVSAKNAFEVPLIDLQRLPDFAQSLENEYAWKKLSSTLENDYKIYGYRVDAIHSIAYNILHAMARRQQDAQSIQNAISEQKGVESQMQKINEQPELKQYLKGQFGQHLEKKLQNLNIATVQMAMRVDSSLERIRRQFDQLGSNALLLNTLSLDDQLCLQLVSRGNAPIKYPPWGQYDGPWSVDDPLMAFTQLDNFRLKIDQKLGKMRGEQVNNIFGDDKQNYFNGNYDQMQMEDFFQQGKKAISHEIHYKHRILRTDKDFLEDAQKWMDDADRKFMGIKLTGKNQNKVKAEIKQQILIDKIDFEYFDIEEETRSSVFKKQTDKMEFNEEIQDRFLLAPKLTSSLNLSQHVLTLYQVPDLPAYQQQLPEVQVDVRRQQVSIMESKRRLTELMHERSTFRGLYQGFCQRQQVSPALCFLTVLHLANQNGLSFEQLDEGNFYIR